MNRQFLKRYKNRDGSLMIHITICSEQLLSLVEMKGNYTSKDSCEMLESRVFFWLVYSSRTAKLIQNNNISINLSREIINFLETL